MVRRAIGISLAVACVIALAAIPQPVGAAIDHSSVDITGAGTRERGRELGLGLSIRNSATNPELTPEVIDRIVFRSPSIRFNGGARSVATCHSSVPRDGSAARCPRKSKVGSGSVTAILGTPGESAKAFGVLSRVSGKLAVYNYRRRGTEQARLLAVVDSAAPFSSVTINLMFRVTAKGVLEIDIPRLRDLPRPIRKSYPSKTKVVLEKLRVQVNARRERSGRPFIWRRWNHRFQLDAEAVGE